MLTGAVREYVANPDISLRDIGEHHGVTQQTVSSSVSKYLKLSKGARRHLVNGT